MKEQNSPVFKKKISFWFRIIVYMLMGLLFFQFFNQDKSPSSIEVSLTQFETQIIHAQGIEKIEMKQKSDRVIAYFNEDSPWIKEVKEGKIEKYIQVESVYPDGYEGDFTKILKETGVELEVDSEIMSIWKGFLINWLPLILIFGLLLWFLSKRGAGGVMKFGKNKKGVLVEKPKKKFDDVAGLEEAKEELQEIKEFLENPQKFEKFGKLKIPKGVLLYGPPGNGKTLLAKAVAGEAGVPFFSIAGSDFVEMFVGIGASRVRDLFEQAKSVAPSILFIDEIDAVGRHRGAGIGGGHDEREQTLNQLLVEMDGFNERTNVIVIAATNRPDILDSALTRPGRFDRQVLIPAPNAKEREEVLRLYACDLPVSEDIDFKKIAHQTYGFSSAGLESIINEAGIIAVRNDKEQIAMLEIERAIEKIVAGPERKSFVLEKRDKLVIAYHESGHALVGYALYDADEVHKLTIVPRGKALGSTVSLPQKERVLEYRNHLWANLAMTLGGRAAEDILSDNPSSGIASDNNVATQIARKMVTEYGMSKLGLRKFESEDSPIMLGRDFLNKVQYSDAKAKEIDDEIDKLIDRAYQNAHKILSRYKNELEATAKGVIASEEETLRGEQIEEILNGTQLAEDKDEWKFFTDKHDEKFGLVIAP